MDPKERERIESLVLEAGRSCGITAARDDVRRALGDPVHGPKFAEWAALNLGPDNLVTPDEMALYASLDKSGEVDRLSGLHDLAEVQAVTEKEIRVAAEELKRSTQVISKQTDALRQRHEALARLIERSAENSAIRRDFEIARRKRCGTERKHISAEVEDLSQSLDFRISDIVQQTGDSRSTLGRIVNEALDADDKLLSSLQKLGKELDQQDPEETQTIDRLREVCMRLIKNTVEMLRVKLDRVYLDSLIHGHHHDQRDFVPEDEVEALQEEVESLYSEILPVAQMSVEQKYLEPALSLVSSQGGQGVSRSAAAVLYISECLDYLLQRTQNLNRKIGSFRSHQIASASLIATARNELAATTELPSPSTVPADPTSPIRPRANSKAPRRSSGIHGESPIEGLLQSLAIRFDDGSEGRQTVEILSRALVERSAKEGDVARSVQESFEAAVTTHLDDAQRALQLLRDSLLAESPYGNVKLADPEIESSIRLLSGELSQARSRLEHAEAWKGTEKSEKKAEIIHRWG